MARLSADIKERFFGSVRSTWSTVQNFTSFRSMPQSDGLDVQCLVYNNYYVIPFEKNFPYHFHFLK
jgi:hypothetical protein